MRVGRVDWLSLVVHARWLNRLVAMSAVRTVRSNPGLMINAEIPNQNIPNFRQPLFAGSGTPVTELMRLCNGSNAAEIAHEDPLSIMEEENTRYCGEPLAASFSDAKLNYTIDSSSLRMHAGWSAKQT